MKKTTEIFLDTDIGTDPDDAMTLVQLRGSGAQLGGITLGYGPTVLREAIARRYLDEMGWEVPLAIGREDTLSGKGIWMSGREGLTLGDLDTEIGRDEDAVSFLATAIENCINPCIILCISPLTNIAELLTLRPEIARKIGHLVIMGGDFSNGAPEHNFLSDVTAANIVLSSGLSTTVIGLDATMQLKLGRTEIERIRESGPVGEMLAREIYDWWDFWNEEWSVPHDPIALVAMLQPDLFTFSKRGAISISTDEDNLGVSHFVPGQGNCRIVEAYDVEKVRSVITEQIVKGARDRASK